MKGHNYTRKERIEVIRQNDDELKELEEQKKELYLKLKKIARRKQTLVQLNKIHRSKLDDKN